jgi:hypothetical protein
MPLRNVATTFTIEQQRLEINALAGDVNNIATGVTNVGTAATANALAAGATGADLTLSGTLTVNGTQTILNTETLQVEDKEIVIGNVATPTDATAHGGGWKLKGANNKTITYNQTGDKWESNKNFEAPNLLYNSGNQTITNTGDTVLTVSGPGHSQLSLTNTSGTDHCSINFGDSADIDAGEIRYTNSSNTLYVETNGTIALSIDSNQDATFTGNINLEEGKKTIFGSNSGNGGYIKHQSGHFEIKNETGNCYWDNSGLVRIRTGGSYTEALSITGGQDVQIPNGYLQIDPTDHDKLKLKVPSGSSDDWAYMTFWGEDGTRNAYIGTNAAGDVKVSRDGGCNLELGANAIFNANVSDTKGNLRDIPKNSSNSQVTIGTTHAGEVVATSSGGWDIPTGVMSPGNTVTLLNDHSGDLPITTNLTILYNTADGTRIEGSTLNLGARGMATIYFWSANAAYIQASSLTVS